MDVDRARARELAQAWWLSEAGARARERGFAYCDRCNTRVLFGEGMLVSPVSAGADGPPDSQMPGPELVCEDSFQGRKAWNPDGGGVLGRPFTPASDLYPPSRKRRRLFAR